MAVDFSKIQELLGDEAETLLNHTSTTIPKDNIHIPGADFVDRIWLQSDRNINVLRSLQTLFSNGRLSGTGYLSILPVDQGIEHSAPERVLRRIRNFLTRKTLSNWQSKAAATPSLRRLVCWVLWRENTHTKYLLSLKSITTNF